MAPLSSSALAPAPSRSLDSILTLLTFQASAPSEALYHLSHLLFRLAREQARTRELQSGNQQLEAQQAELVERLQAMLQAHWEEASHLLSASTLPANPPVGIAFWTKLLQVVLRCLLWKTSSLPREVLSSVLGTCIRKINLWICLKNNCLIKRNVFTVATAHPGQLHCIGCNSVFLMTSRWY